VGQREGDPAGILGSGPKFDYDFAIFQGGHDLYRVEHPDGSRDHAGFYVAAGMGGADVTHFTGLTAGTDKFDAASLGGYWTHFGSSGWYLDGILQGSWYDIKANGGLGTVKTGGTGFASSLEGGYPFWLGRGWLIEPQAQVVYQTVGLDDAADSAAAVRFQDVDSLAARVGVRIAETWRLYPVPRQYRRQLGGDQPRRQRRRQPQYRTLRKRQLPDRLRRPQLCLQRKTRS
jgi:outer membrane autotransporter protein